MSLTVGFELILSNSQINLCRYKFKIKAQNRNNIFNHLGGNSNVVYTLKKHYKPRVTTTIKLLIDRELPITD